MKIGILIKEFNELANWQLRIIEQIRNTQNLELSLLIKDGRLEKKDKVTIASFILKKQISYEKGRYLKNSKSVNKAEIIDYLHTIPTLISNQKIKHGIEVFNDVDIQQVKDYDLDVIIKFGFSIVSGMMLNASKNGIWYLHHSDINLNRSSPPGFCEVLKKESVVGVSLLQLTINKSKANLIDKAFFNRHNHSFVVTNYKILESAVALLMKNLRKFAKEELLVVEKDQSFSENIISPNLFTILKYQFEFYSNFGRGFFKKLESRLGINSNSWTIFIGRGNFLDANLSKLISVKKPSNEFWADPFLFLHEKEAYVFFEKFPFATQRGIISCGKIVGNNLVDVIDVLDLPYHLSYPFIFEEEGEIFMMPETGGNKRLEIYKCIDFPLKWELFSTAFEGEEIVDASLYTDKNNEKWLFMNKSSGPGTSKDNELYIYRIDSLKFNKVESHHENPIYIDSRVARNGGAIFSYKNNIYRPSQRNTDGIYGKALNINRIEKLTIFEYEEVEVEFTKVELHKIYKSMHHMHQIKDFFVFDAVCLD